MSQQWQGPNATWQGPDEKRWNNALEEEFPPLPNEEDDVAATSAPPTFSTDEPDEEDERFSSGRFETVRQLGQQFSPVLVPLLFAGLTLLFIVPLLLSNKVYLHAERLWPIALVLLALAILQGTMLYYAGSNTAFWSLGVGGGFLLFMLAACFTVFGPIPTGIFLAVVVVVCLIGARLYMRPVPEGTVDIVYAFGKYTRTLYPGLNFLLPWEWVDAHLLTREIQWTCPEQTVRVSPDADVHLKAVISYQLMPEDAYLAITHVENWEESLHTLFEACLQQASNELKPEDFVAWPRHSRQGHNLRLNESEDDETTRWARVNKLLFQRMRDRVANWGVLINWVHIRDITLTPRSSLTYNTDQMDSPQSDTSHPAPAPSAQAQHVSRKPGADNVGKREAPAPAVPVTHNVSRAAPTPAAAPAPAPAPVAKSPQEEALITAYKQIQNEKIKSPATIRDVAARFLAIANDPEASKNVSFDAARAAQALYDRADFYEKQASINETFEDDDSPTQADWPYRRSADDNYTAGG
ncbi:MAG: SPFH domain-containing protein [Ktedonobacteraceae bacterium]